ncbi:glycosyltransferase family 4 protein [Caldiplasma sukawensis]
MKICILVRVLWPGGVQRIAFAEAEGLTKLGNEVDLIFIRSTNRLAYDSNVNYKVIFNQDVNKRIFGKILSKITHYYSPQRGKDATVDIDLIYKTEHKIKEDYDIIYYFDEFSAFFQKYHKKIHKNKSVVLLHEVALSDGSRLARFAQRRAIKNADLVLTNTNANLQLLKDAGVKNSLEIYPGLILHDDIPKFDERENIAISVTMWDFGRKPEVLVEISKHIRNGKIIIAGSWADINYLNRFKKAIVDSGLKDQIFVTGKISEEYLTELYRKAKVSIRFGYNEKGPGMGSLESISWGLPLIINEGIGIKEIIENDKNGYIVKETDYKTIALLIERLFNNENEWTKISENNISLSQKFTWENHCKLLNSKFKDLISVKN